MKSVRPHYSLGFFVLHAARWLVTSALLVLLGIGVYIGIRFYHVDNQLYEWWHAIGLSQTASPWKTDLSLQYRMDVDSRVVAGIDKNLSGLAFNTDTNQLIAVINRPATLLTMDLEGRVLHRHRLRHASDVEGVAYLGNNHIALVEEGRNRVVIAQLPKTGNGELDLQKAASFSLDLATSKENTHVNAGFEGLGYDQVHDQLYVAKEHSPRALYRISGLGDYAKSGRLVMRVENLDAWLKDGNIGTDLSSVEFNAVNGHLLLLSDESQRIIELDQTGAVVNRMELRGMPGSNEGVPQAEGLAVGPRDTLYMVSEPNLFYRLQAASAKH